MVTCARGEHADGSLKTNYISFHCFRGLRKRLIDATGILVATTKLRTCSERKTGTILPPSLRRLTLDDRAIFYAHIVHLNSTFPHPQVPRPLSSQLVPMLPPLFPSRTAHGTSYHQTPSRVVSITRPVGFVPQQRTDLLIRTPSKEEYSRSDETRHALVDVPSCFESSFQRRCVPIIAVVSSKHGEDNSAPGHEPCWVRTADDATGPTPSATSDKPAMAAKVGRG